MALSTSEVVHGLLIDRLLCSSREAPSATPEEQEKAIFIPSDLVLETHKSLLPQITCPKCKAQFQALHDDHFGI
jgi:hypothetical protein